MQAKSPLPWDLDQAMTALQVNPEWYEEYWLKPKEAAPPNLTASRSIRMLVSSRTPTNSSKAARRDLAIHGEPGDSIDFAYYRGCAKRERNLAIEKTCKELIAIVLRLFRYIQSTPSKHRSDYSTVSPKFRLAALTLPFRARK